MVLYEKVIGKVAGKVSGDNEKKAQIAQARSKFVKTEAEKYLNTHTTQQRLSLGEALGIDKNTWANNDSDRDLLTVEEKQVIETESEQWATGFGVWHADTGPAYNTMSLDAHPFKPRDTQERERLRISCDIYNLLYYFDDLISNDRSKKLSGAEKEAAEGLMFTLLLKLNKKCGVLGLPDVLLAKHISRKSADAVLPPAFSGILPAMGDIMTRLDGLADRRWQKKFYGLLVNHLIDATTDHDSDSRLTDTEWYVPTRRKVAGMPVMLALAELIAGGAINRKMLDKKIESLNGVKVSQMLLVLEESVMDIGGIWNDLISAPKEILRDNTVFNIVSVHCLQLVKENKFESFEQVLAQVIDLYGVGYRQKFDSAYFELSTYLDANKEKLEPEVYDHVRQYVYALRRIVIGTWDWQHGRGKKRYEANTENNLPQHFFQDFQGVAQAFAGV